MWLYYKKCQEEAKDIVAKDNKDNKKEARYLVAKDNKKEAKYLVAKDNKKEAKDIVAKDNKDNKKKAKDKEEVHQHIDYTRLMDYSTQ